MKKAKLADITDAIDLQTDDMSSYLNRETNETVNMPAEIMAAVDDGEDPKEIMETFGCDEHDIKAAQEINQGDHWLPLPSRYDIDEYRLMERFCQSRKDPELRNRLLSAIKGKGAFRRFKDTTERTGVLEQWYEYREKEIKEIARQWCDENGVECE